MATTFIDYDGDGVANKPFSFPSIQESDIKVDVDGVIKSSGTHYNITGYTTGSGGTVVFTSGNIPVAPQVIRISRNTDVDTAKATYTPGSSVRAADLNSNNKQLLFHAQEESDQTIVASDIKDGAITSAKITDHTIVNADINPSAAIDGTKVNPNFGSQNIATTGTINSLTTTELAILDGATVSTAELNKLDGVTATTAEINKLDGVTATTAEINKLDGVTSTTAELNHVDGVTSNVQTQLDGKQDLSARLTTLAGMQSGTASKLADSTALTADLADLNQLDGMTKQTQLTDDDTKFPTSGAIVDYVAAQLAPIGGFEVIATDAAFPNTQPASGVVISIADGGGLVVNGSGTSTTGRTVGGSTVTINNFASNFNNTTVDPGVAILVSSTGSGQVYNYHKATLKEADLLSLSGDINDFAERYRVVASEPTTDNDEGDLIYDKSADSIKVYDATAGAFKTINTVGDFKFLFLCPTGGSGAPTFDGTINTYDLRVGSNSGTAATVVNAAQLIVSIDGVIQKPNTGTSQPAEGFAMVDNNTIIFGSNLEAGVQVFISQIGDAVNIGTPHDNTVSTVKVQNLAVTTDKIADDAVTTDKLANSIVSDITANNAKVSNQGTDLSTSTTTTAVTVASSDGTNATIGEATGSAAGVMSSAHHDKLDGIEAGATGDQTNAEIRAAVEAATDSNVFTDADHSKLNGIEAGATADQTAEEIQDIVGAMLSGNTESGITVTYQDADGTIDFTVASQTDENFTTADHAKLDGIEASATADQTASEIVALVADQTIAPSTIDMEDNEQIKLGTGDDLQIKHDGTDSRITNSTGYLYIDTPNVAIRSDGGQEDAIQALANGAVNLFYNGSKKLETHASNGVQFPGGLQAPDSEALRLGNSNDLLIFHDGTDSIIRNSTGALLLQTDSDFKIEAKDGGKDIIHGVATGSVELHYDGSRKLHTLSDGVNVTGTLKVNGSAIASGGLGNVVEDTTPQLGGDLQSNGNNIDFADNDQAIFGTGSDLILYHSGSNSFLLNNTGYLRIASIYNALYIDGNNINFRSGDGNETLARFLDNGAVELYYDGALQCQTNSGGMNWADGKRAYFGNSSDLQIYHDGSRSNIADTGTGGLHIYTDTLRIRNAANTESLIKGNENGNVELYYDNSKKLETTSSGATITGTTTSNYLQLSAVNPNITFTDTNENPDYQLGVNSGQLVITDTTNSADRLIVQSSGLTVTGSIIATNNIQVNDNKNLYVGNSGDLQIRHDATNSEIKNNTGGLYINTASNGIYLRKGASEELARFNVDSSVELYFNNSKKFETKAGGAEIHGYLQLSSHIYMADSDKVLLGNAQDLELYHNGSHSYINNKTGNLYIMAKSGEVGIQVNPDDDVRLRYNDSNKLYTASYGIQVGSAGGSVFSGLSNYQAYVGFDASSSSSFGGVAMGSGPNGNSPFVAATKAGNGTGLNLHFRTNGSKRFEIQNNGNIGAPSGSNIYYASDERLKKNVTLLDKGLEAIKALRPVSFNWVDGFCDVEKDKLYGFIAQEVETVDSNLVSPFGDDVELGEDQVVTNPLRVNEKFIIPMLVKAVQELSAKVTALEAA